MKLVVVDPDLAPAFFFDDGEVTCRPDPDAATVAVEFRATFTLAALEHLTGPKALMGLGGAVVLTAIDALRTSMGIEGDLVVVGPLGTC